jgi:hypothetical protein
MGRLRGQNGFIPGFRADIVRFPACRTDPVERAAVGRARFHLLAPVATTADRVVKAFLALQVNGLSQAHGLAVLGGDALKSLVYTPHRASCGIDTGPPGDAKSSIPQLMRRCGHLSWFDVSGESPPLKSRPRFDAPLNKSSSCAINETSLLLAFIGHLWVTIC